MVFNLYCEVFSVHCTSVPVYIVKVCQYASVPVCQCASVPVCQYASVPVCKIALGHDQLLTLTFSRRQLRNRGVSSALNTMKKMPNFRKSYLEFVFKETQEEAKTAAQSLAKEEQKPSLLNREALKSFSFGAYYDNLHKIAPIITTTLVAASSKIKYREIKVGSVQCTMSSVQCAVYHEQCAVCSVP